MRLERRATDFAKRTFSPQTQERLKGMVRRWRGPRRPNPLKPAPSDAQGAARHAVLVAHASRRSPDHSRARRAMGRWTIAQPGWRVPGPDGVKTSAAARPVVVLANGQGHADFARAADVFVLGLPGADPTACDTVLLPNAAELLNSLGLHEQAAVLVAASRGALLGLNASAVTAAPSNDPLAAAIARSLSPRETPMASQGVDA